MTDAGIQPARPRQTGTNEEKSRKTDMSGRNVISGRVKEIGKQAEGPSENQGVMLKWDKYT